ncbi:hypothetical protein IX321_000225 [Bacteroides pyogenes]|nr:hypothetical protein [Bacteroides pyogenes]MBR8716263.1 hypothetical protein [Bacteroides pyogenes]MBR8745802.1 hypothetical protein [Bacteroides pyogenes]MBR8756099.1 hypothetical protein [Bacteroides pyogenes]MBR8779413.1 hypothetical protein [Bacteroides pyogenes]
MRLNIKNRHKFTTQKKIAMNEPISQSCGMNMKTVMDFETNTNETPNKEYCHYCYLNGMFTRNMTMEILNISIIWNEETGSKFTSNEARPILYNFLLALKGWKNT